MKIKKALCGAVALLLSASMLAACGDSAAPENSPSQQASSASGEASPSGGETGGAEKVNGVMYKEGLPIVDPGSYTFSLFVDDGQEDSDYVMFPILEEQTGVKVDLWMYPNAIAQEKLSLQLNSGDYADCIGGWTLSSNDILIHGVDEGIYVPLDQYFADYCPKITEILELQGVRDTMTTPDGHIYSIPYALEAPLVPYLPYVNTEWLKNVNMEMPTTTEEFKAMLKAFKEQDANGNGDPNDEIPFTAGPDNKHLGDLCGWFGMSVVIPSRASTGENAGFTMKDGKLTFGANTEEFKNGIKFLAELYREGLIDPELFTQDSAQWKAKGAQNIYGCSVMYSSADIMPYDPGVVPNWAPLPVLKSPNVEKPCYLRDTYGTTVLKNQVVVTDNAEHPEVIARWWDNFFQLDNVLQSQNGPLDVTLFKEADGSYRTIDKTTLSEEEQKLYDWGNLWPQALPKYVPAGFKVKQEVETYDEKKPADALYEPYLTDMIRQVWASAEDTTKLADLTTAIANYLQQKVAEWISGQSDIDADWDSYLAQLDKLKLQELIDLRMKMLGE